MMRGQFAAKKQHEHKWTGVLSELLVMILFFAGLALIAAGLWLIWPPVAMIFGGVATLYLAGCVDLAAKHAERTVKK